MTQKTSQRDISLDIVRSLAMLWIIFIWHLCDYIGFTLVNNHFCVMWTRVSLGTFFFISGYLIALRYSIVHFKDWALFYKKRIIRIYPLFILSLITLSVGLPDVRHCFWQTLSGISAYIPPQPSILWFVSILISFYVLTPLFIYGRSTRRCLLFSILFFIILVGLHILNYGLDIRLLRFFPFYALGLFLGLKQQSLKTIVDQRSKGLILIFFIALFLIGLILDYIHENWMIELVAIWGAILGGMFILLLIGYSRLLTTQYAKIFGMISYLSFTAYLFHRQIYGFYEIVIKRCNISEITGIGIIVILGSISVLFFSYWLQSGYDYLYERLFKRFRKK